MTLLTMTVLKCQGPQTDLPTNQFSEVLELLQLYDYRELNLLNSANDRAG